MKNKALLWSTTCKEYRNALPERVVICDCGWSGQMRELVSNQLRTRDNKLLIEQACCPMCFLVITEHPWNKPLRYDFNQLRAYAVMRKDKPLLKALNLLTSHVFEGLKINSKEDGKE